MHRFKIGQIVEIMPTTLRSAAPGPYEIIRLLPWESGAPQYCLRSSNERHERVIPEHDLLPVTDPVS
jgi:hypothetical protein